MKKSLLVMAALSFIVSYPLESQGVFSKVKNAVAKEILGTNNKDSNSSERGLNRQVRAMMPGSLQISQNLSLITKK